jgi:hypothetical protein
MHCYTAFIQARWLFMVDIQNKNKLPVCKELSLIWDIIQCSSCRNYMYIFTPSFIHITEFVFMNNYINWIQKSTNYRPLAAYSTNMGDLLSKIRFMNSYAILVYKEQILNLPPLQIQFELQKTFNNRRQYNCLFWHLIGSLYHQTTASKIK